MVCPNGSRCCKLPLKSQASRRDSERPLSPQGFPSPMRVAQSPGKQQWLISSCSCNVPRGVDADKVRTDPGRGGHTTSALAPQTLCTMQGSTHCWGEAREQQLGLESWPSLGSPAHRNAGHTVVMAPLCSPLCRSQLVHGVGLVSAWLSSPAICST